MKYPFIVKGTLSLGRYTHLGRTHRVTPLDDRFLSSSNPRPGYHLMLALTCSLEHMFA